MCINFTIQIKMHFLILETKDAVNILKLDDRGSGAKRGGFNKAK
jgi:hypothetical protein